jgi:hypothetical protein
MEEVVVATVDNEPVAELIAGRLRVEGIAVRVRFESQAGIPRQLVPGALGFGPGAFRVSVAATHAGRAREILGEAQPESRRDRPAVRTIAAIMLAFVVFALLQSVVQLFALLAGRL